VARVPKGFLRFYVLKLLQKRPMSGAEIMKEIASETGDMWKPSPGSIYPLLAWLRDNGFVKEVPVEEGGMKRYELTEKGKEMLKEQERLKEELFEKMGYWVPPPLLDLMPPPGAEHLRKLVEARKRFLIAYSKLSRELRRKPSKELLEEAAKLFEELARKMEEFSERVSK